MQCILRKRLLRPKLSPFFSSSTAQVGPTRLQSPPPEPPPAARSPLDEARSRDVFLSNQIISDCVRSGDLATALDIFRGMPVRTTVTWNSVLAGYSKRRGNLKEARELFDSIPQPDVVSYNTMLSCYVNSGKMGLARGFFDGMPIRDSASWNTMISGFVRSKKMDMARGMFSRMPDKNAVSWNAMISGYVECGDVDSAAELFEAAPVKNVVAWTAMINGYMKVGKVELAEKLFLEMPQKNVVTWNAMIAGYVLNCRSEDGVKLFRTMLGEGIGPYPSTFSSVLLGCSELSALSLGKQVHQLVSKSPLSHDTMAGTSLVSMYCKCGNMEDAWRLFLEIPRKDVVSWNAIISGYAQHGVGAKALSLFDEMMEQGVRPDSITFVAIILACNHAGLVDLGRKYFRLMVSDYGVQMKREHYTCMVDLLGRAGELKEAADLIKEMPYKPYPALFGTLLGACRIHKNVEMAEFAAENLLKLDPGSATAFVQLANVYAAVGNWDQVARVRKSMKSNEVVKTPGYSWMEIGSIVHEFRSGDTVHPELPSIHNKLNELEPKMKLAGYVPDLEFALHDVGEEQKRQLLLHHSEKLAVAYGLLKLPRRTTIQVFKNLRICGDCHVAMKHISAIERREIMIRDTTRFHRFKDGACSCGDYW